MSSLLPLSLHPRLSFDLHRKTFSPLLLSLSSTAKFRIHATSSNPDREEIRWIREEQRWLREEQRWLREEQRWILERESFLREISELKLQLKALQSRNFGEGVSVSDTIANISGLLQVLKEKNLIADKATLLEEEKIIDEEEQKEVIEEEGNKKVSEEEKAKELIRVLEVDGKKWRTLRKGSEGEEVKAMQEALLKLGFFSGEEDMEFSSFSSGTERAVKTWQATLGAPEDGIVTTELLERLYIAQQVKDSGTNISSGQKEATSIFPEKVRSNYVVANCHDLGVFSSDLLLV